MGQRQIKALAKAAGAFLFIISPAEITNF